MIDNSHRGLFFIATALMCAVVSYGSELASADPDELATTLSGAPRQLTLPPGFKTDVASTQSEAPSIAVNPVPCAQGKSSMPADKCASDAVSIKSKPGFTPAATSEKVGVDAASGIDISVGSAVR